MGGAAGMIMIILMVMRLTLFMVMGVAFAILFHRRAVTVFNRHFRCQCIAGFNRARRGGRRCARAAGGKHRKSSASEQRQ